MDPFKDFMKMGHTCRLTSGLVQTLKDWKSAVFFLKTSGKYTGKIRGIFQNLDIQGNSGNFLACSCFFIFLFYVCFIYDLYIMFYFLFYLMTNKKRKSDIVQFANINPQKCCVYTFVLMFYILS